MRRRPDLALFWTLLFGQLLILALTPTLVGHDLPQHMAYARLLGDWDAGRLAGVYEGPSGEDPYFATYHVLAWLARAMPLETAFRLVYALYAVTMSFAFAALARAASEASSGQAHMTSALGPLFVQSPIVCMGFLPFMLGMPAVLFGIAGALRFGKSGRVAWLAVVVAVSALLGSLHMAALAMLLLALGCLLLARPCLRSLASLGGAVISGAGVVALYARRMPAAEPFDWDRLGFNVKTFGWLDGVSGSFRLSWSPPALKAKMSLATVAGPFPAPVKALVLVGLVALGVVIVTSRNSPSRSSVSRRSLTIASTLFLAAALFVPTAIQVPDDMCLIDFRMFVLAFAMFAAAIPGAWFAVRSSRVALGAFGALLTATWAWAIFGLGEEARPAVALARQLGPEDRVLALSFHDRSAYLDEENDVLHYLPVHHTALSGGTTTLFWGKFSRHLPVGYGRGLEPPHPAVWKPEEFNDAQVAAATHLFVSFPDEADGPEKIAGSSRVLGLVGTRVDEVACQDRFCLYSVRKEN